MTNGSSVLSKAIFGVIVIVNLWPYYIWSPVNRPAKWQFFGKVRTVILWTHLSYSHVQLLWG